jgi:hypothetical protein
VGSPRMTMVRGSPSRRVRSAARLSRPSTAWVA